MHEGIHELLKQHGIEPVIITGRKSEIVAQRARELEIRQVYQGVGNKVAKIEELIQESQQAGHEAFDASNIAYIGDDDNDLPAIVIRVLRELRQMQSAKYLRQSLIHANCRGEMER